MAMEKKATSVCILLGILGVAATIFGFTAEATRVKYVDDIDVLTATCYYPSSPAHALGIAAAVILFITQVIINITTGCACCRRKAPSDMLSSNTTIQRIFATVSWIGFIVGFVLFLDALVLNKQSNDATLKGAYYWCYVVKPGVFAGAAVLTLVSVGAGIGYINLVFKPALTASDVEGQGTPGAIPIGQPQFDQQQPQYNQKQQHQQMVAQPPMGLAQPVQYPPPNPHY